MGTLALCAQPDTHLSHKEDAKDADGLQFQPVAGDDLRINPPTRIGAEIAQGETPLYSQEESSKEPPTSDPRAFTTEARLISDSDEPPAATAKKSAAAKSKDANGTDPDASRVSEKTTKAQKAKTEKKAADEAKKKRQAEICARMKDAFDGARSAPKNPALAMAKQAFFDSPQDVSSALPGRKEIMQVAKVHYVLNTPMQGPWPESMEQVIFANGCFWGSEKGAWKLPGVYSTAVGYAAGFTANCNYDDVCSGRTGAVEAVKVVFDPKVVSIADVLRWFWQSHDPTQGDGQGSDRGSMYRSGLYFFEDDHKLIMEASKNAYRTALKKAGKGQKPGAITTEIRSAKFFETMGPGAIFYYAEDEHQQYLAKPHAKQHCSAEPTGVSLPTFYSWCPPALQTKYAPKLPEAFWDEHAPTKGCLLSPESHEQIQWPTPKAFGG